MRQRRRGGEVLQFVPKAEATPEMATENIEAEEREAVLVSLDHLISRAREQRQRGDLDALFRIYQDDLIETIGEVVQKPALTADILQDVMIAAWEGIDSIPAGQTFRAWLLDLARDTALNRLEKTEVERPSGLTPQGEGVAEVERVMEERRAVVQAAIEQLPPKMREVIELHYTNGKSVDEMSQELHLPPATVTRRLDLAQRNLQMILRTSGLANEEE